ncbi:Hypothetical predicted protein, partial [Podarcis lilfordi]
VYILVMMCYDWELNFLIPYAESWHQQLCSQLHDVKERKPSYMKSGVVKVVPLIGMTHQLE